MRKPVYAYGLYRAARLASRLVVERISALELAGGRGLLALERRARDIGRMFDVQMDVVGLDTGEGLTAPQDHRDLPYRFAEGNYAIDEAELRSRLKRARLILGDAAVTFGELLAIREFNDGNTDVKIAEDRAFRALSLNFGWHHGCYVMHRFAHPDYARHVHTASAGSLALP